MADISCNITFNCRVFWRRFISITTWTIPHVYCFCKFSLCYQPHHYKHKLFRQQYQIFFLQSDDSASFLRAARGGNSEKVLEYLKNGIDINTCNAVSFNIQCPSHTAPVARRVGGVVLYTAIHEGANNYPICWLRLSFSKFKIYLFTL